MTDNLDMKHLHDIGTPPNRTFDFETWCDATVGRFEPQTYQFLEDQPTFYAPLGRDRRHDPEMEYLRTQVRVLQRELDRVRGLR